jgi:hypothetical protein
MTDDRSNRQRSAGFRFAAICAILLGMFALYDWTLLWLMRHDRLVLGAVGPKPAGAAGREVVPLVPLYMYWEPHVKTGLLVALAVLGGFYAWIVRVLWPGRWQTQWLLLALVGWHLAIACSVAGIDGGGLRRLWRPYELLTESDYIGAVPYVTSAREFLRDYVSLMPRLPVHCQTHPPGAILFLWSVGQCLGTGAMFAGLATIVASSLSVPAVYGFAREVLDPSAARLATCWFILAPNVVLFSATSMDAVFAVPLIWSSFLLWKARGSSRPWLYGIAGGIAAAIAALMTFSAAFLAVWAGAVVFVTLVADRARLLNTCLTLLAAAFSASACYALLYLWSGYNLLTTLAAARHYHEVIMAGEAHGTWRQHWHLVVANPVAFLFAAGIPLTALWAGHVVRQVRPGLRDGVTVNGATARRDLRWLSLSFVLALVVIDLAPLYTLEVEHIWLFMVPWLAIGAAGRLTDSSDGDLTLEARLALGLQMLQVVLMEVLLQTTW